ncbi:WD40 repeat-like protein [Gonapodya prolifera JEL478]|uniref:WD40 repeat-like protein n=1 Tax=Gonapodya prolifera (strain JEL478) TaxID=1344416 RepID=A0A139AGY8_GONPJ|nr:WD40 repeat-like protein [Gonapodya prolifera JEL478]|eukprot:KXS15824.1 WD40 repeat-like protein [Gonapodya prolifera JEL478]
MFPQSPGPTVFPHTIASPNEPMHATACSVSPTSSLLAVGTRSPALHLFSLSSFLPTLTITPPDPPSSISIHPTGSILVTGGRKGVEVWDPRTAGSGGKEKGLHSLKHREAVVALEVDQWTGMRVVAGSLDRVVKVWDLRSLRSHPPIPLHSDPTSVHLSPHRLLVSHRGPLLAFNPASFEPLRSIPIAGGGADVSTASNGWVVVSPGFSPRCEWVDVTSDGPSSALAQDVEGQAQGQLTAHVGVGGRSDGDDGDDESFPVPLSITVRIGGALCSGWWYVKWLSSQIIWLKRAFKDEKWS